MRHTIFFILTTLPLVGPAVSHAQTCSEICTSDPSHCLEVSSFDGDGTDNPLQGLSAMYSILKDPSIEIITQSMLLDAFDLEADPCDRSDTVLFPQPTATGVTNLYIAENSGDLCRVGGKMTLPSGREMDVEILVPSELSINLLIGEEKIDITRPLVSFTVPLIFSIDSFMSDFGGLIDSVELFSDRTFIQTANGCIVVPH